MVFKRKMSLKSQNLSCINHALELSVHCSESKPYRRETVFLMKQYKVRNNKCIVQKCNDLELGKYVFVIISHKKLFTYGKKCHKIQM